MLSLSTSMNWFCSSTFHTALLVLIDEFNTWWCHKFTLMSGWALEWWFTIYSNCYCFARSMTATHHIRLFLPYPCRCWLSFNSTTLHGRTLPKVHSASNLCSSCALTYRHSPLPNLIYAFATGCLLFILNSVRCSGDRTCLIQEQSFNVSVDSDGWLLLKVARWFFNYDDAFLGTFLQRCRSCCFALIQ